VIGGSTTLVAQMPGLCDPANRPAGAVEGGFEIIDNITIGCSPLEIKVRDLTGGSNIYYDFDYNGEGVNFLNGSKNTAGILIAKNNSPTTYTVLQYGEKDGKAMYNCKQVSIRNDSKAVYSTSNCDPGSLKLTIPKDVLNAFDSYEISWGDGSLETVTQLPFTKTHNYQTSDLKRRISVSGKNSSGLNDCPVVYEEISMLGRSGQPIISSLEVLSGGNEVELTLEGIDLDYEIFSRNPALEPNYSTNPLTSAKPGKMIFPLPNGDPTCFTAFSYPGCPKTSGEICTIQIDDIISAGKTSEINWSLYPLGITTTTGFANLDAKSVSSDVRLIKQISSNTSEIDITPSSQNKYIDNSGCDDEVCYQVEMVISGVTSGGKNLPYTSKTLSEKKCLIRSEFHPPALTDLTISVENDNKIVLNFDDNSDWPLIKTNYYLNNSSGVTISTTTLPDKFDINPKNVNSEVECFYINYMDECKSISENSPTVCTSLLSYNNQNEIYWNQELPFGSETVLKYEILITDEISGIESIKSEVISSPLPIDLNDFLTVGIFRIRTIGSSGGISYSNVLKIPLKPSFYVPTVFTPNGDSINDSFEIKGRWGQVESFTVKIYSRSGQQIQEITYKDKAISPVLDISQFFTGHYLYTIEAVLVDKEIIKTKGSFVVLP
jgi:gliding motility-associated-like protein